MSRLAGLFVGVLLGASGLSASGLAAGAPPSARSEMTLAEQELGRAQATTSERDRRARAEASLAHYEASYALDPSWQAAAGASEASLLLGSSAAASAWYWIASDRADYSESYLGWQKGALARVFDGRAAYTFELSEPASALRIDGSTMPTDAHTRPLALDVGRHAIAAGAVSGNTFQGTLQVDETMVDGRHFFPVQFSGMLRAGEEDSLGPGTRARPKADTGGMGALQIATIIGTVTLAAGIAVGGGYLLYGPDNPRGFDSAQGAAVIITELVLIGGGTTIALLAD